jgi:hypothetical protein
MIYRRRLCDAKNEFLLLYIPVGALLLSATAALSAQAARTAPWTAGSSQAARTAPWTAGSSQAARTAPWAAGFSQVSWARATLTDKPIKSCIVPYNL